MQTYLFPLLFSNVYVNTGSWVNLRLLPRTAAFKFVTIRKIGFSEEQQNESCKARGVS